MSKITNDGDGSWTREAKRPKPQGVETVEVDSLEYILQLVPKEYRTAAKQSIQALIRGARIKAIEDFRKNVDSFEYEYDGGEKYLAKLKKLRGI